MSKKIHQELSRIAKEILDDDIPLNFQKVYDQTLSLFEQLILIKNSGELRKDLWQELDLKYDNEIDSKNNYHQNQSPLRNEVKDIAEETNHNKTFEAQLTDTTLRDLTFEPKDELSIQKDVVKERLNDKFSKGLQIDLNDRQAFIKYLFDKKPNDYQRAISQISTFQDWSQAKAFILEIVKPDYDQWKGKELYERRFLKTIENNF